VAFPAPDACQARRDGCLPLRFERENAPEQGRIRGPVVGRGSRWRLAGGVRRLDRTLLLAEFPDKQGICRKFSPDSSRSAPTPRSISLETRRFSQFPCSNGAGKNLTNAGIGWEGAGNLPAIFGARLRPRLHASYLKKLRTTPHRLPARNSTQLRAQILRRMHCARPTKRGSSRILVTAYLAMCGMISPARPGNRTPPHNLAVDRGEARRGEARLVALPTSPAQE